jgi:hypothetical protein
MGKKQRAWSGMVSLCERYCCPFTHPLGNLPSLVILQVILPWILGQPSLDLPLGGPFLQGCVSWFEPPSKGCQYYNDPKQATSHTYARTLMTSKWVISKQRSDQLWWSWVGLNKLSERVKKFTCDNIQFSLMQHISSSSKVIRISSFHFMF